MRWRSTPPVVRPLSVSEASPPRLAVCTAGSRPKTRLVRAATPKVKASTPVDHRGVRGAKPRRRQREQRIHAPGGEPDAEHAAEEGEQGGSP